MSHFAENILSTAQALPEGSLAGCASVISPLGGPCR